jgi:beta-glucosidase
MPGSYPGNFLNEKLAQAVRRGEVTEKTVDEMVRRTLRAMFTAQSKAPAEPAQANIPNHINTARFVSDESITLLKNSGNLLPLNRNGKYKIAVIGPAAAAKHGFSGGSSAVDSPYEISPLRGIQGFVGPDVQVEYAQGLPYATDEGLVVPETEYAGKVIAKIFAGTKLEGEPIAEYGLKTVTLTGIGEGQKRLPKTNYSVRFETTLKPTKTGQYKLGTRSDDGSRLYVDGKLVVDNWKDQQATTKLATVDLIAGTEYKVTVEYYQGGGEAECSLIWIPLNQGRDPEFWKAIDLAKKSDIAIVCVGTNHNWDTEGWDKPSLKLMGEQDLLVRAVAQANPKTVVVLTNGSPVEIESWDEDVKAILEAWYPGMEGGNSLARILFGAISPSGKLPVSFPVQLSDSPAHRTPGLPSREYPGLDKQLDYSEGLLIGYRWFDAKGIRPSYPFGHGLSYTTFRYEELHEVVKSGTKAVMFDLLNSGSREGAEVAQLYVRPLNAPVARPVKELKGFQKVWLKPGERKSLVFELPREAFAYFDASQKKWRVDAGSEFEVLIGSSSRDIRLRLRVKVKDGSTWAD